MDDERMMAEPKIDEDLVDIDSLLNEIEALESQFPVNNTKKKAYTTSLVDPDPEEKKTAVPLPEEKLPTDVKTDKKQKKGFFYFLFDWAKIIVLAVLVALLINNFLIANALIPSGSMENTIMTGDRIIGLRVSYWFSDPQRGDIVIFKYPDDESKLFIKRVIGLPGDKIEIVDGLVYINDSSESLPEEYLSVTPKGSFGPYEVPEDSYFMLGDNRNVSKDSRYWENTFVHKDKIVAKAFFRYYPSFKAIK